MTAAALLQFLSAVGTIIALLGVGWRISKYFVRLTDKVQSLDVTMRRVEIRMRTFNRRIEQLEDDQKGDPRWR